METVAEIATQCDGMRCDMAMLQMNPIFERTWGERAGPKPDREYWPEVIRQVKARHPGTLFIAEAYWDLEWELQQPGFDYCYDKRLYDRLEGEGAECVRLHLLADRSYQEKLVRFIESHDEPRAAAAFAPEKEWAAAVVTTTLPGAKLLHEGQLEGRKVRLQVFLGRRPHEIPDRALRDFYARLLQAVRDGDFLQGTVAAVRAQRLAGQRQYRHIVAWSWERSPERRLVVINLSDGRAQVRVQVPWADLGGRPWTLADVLTGDRFERDGSEMRDPWLYVDLGPWCFHFLRCAPAD